MSGWIKLYRSILENPLYFSEDFNRTHAWIDLILLANHKDGFFFKRGIRVDVKRGQVGYDLDSLGKRWGWSRGKVERFLIMLENDGQVARQKNNVTSLISIVKYEEYQADDKAKNKANDKPNGNKQECKENNNIIKNNIIDKDLLLSDYLKSEKKYDFISKKEEVLMKWFLNALSFNGEYFEKSMKLKTSYESLKLLLTRDKVTNDDLCLLIGFIAHASKLKIDNVHLKNIKSISYLTKEESNNDIKRWRSLLESAKEQYAKNKEFKTNIDSMIENLNKYE
jgi:hypothetical protein